MGMVNSRVRCRYIASSARMRQISRVVDVRLGRCSGRFEVVSCYVFGISTGSISGMTYWC